MRAFLISSVFLTSDFASFQASFSHKGHLCFINPSLSGRWSVASTKAAASFLHLPILLPRLPGPPSLTQSGQRPFLFFCQMPRWSPVNFSDCFVQCHYGRIERTSIIGQVTVLSGCQVMSFQTVTMLTFVVALRKLKHWMESQMTFRPSSILLLVNFVASLDTNYYWRVSGTNIKHQQVSCGINNRCE